MAAARPDSRVKVLEEIAARYDELVDPLTRTGVKGDGAMAGVLTMPATYTATVREFERLARALRQSEPHLYWHVKYWYMAVVRAQKLIPRAVKRRNRKTEWVAEPCIVTYRHQQADQDTALRGLEWMAEHWRLGTEPMLPAQLATPGTPHTQDRAQPVSHQPVEAA